MYFVNNFSSSLLHQICFQIMFIVYNDEPLNPFCMFHQFTKRLIQDISIIIPLYWITTEKILLNNYS